MEQRSEVDYSVRTSSQRAQQELAYLARTSQLAVRPLILVLLNQARTSAARAWFLEIALVRASVCVCVSVCPPPRPLITSGAIWCDIDHVQLVKQVLRLFPAFNYFIRQLPSIKWMGVAILTQLVVNACQRKLR